MYGSYAQQNKSCAASNGVSFAARFCAFVLVLLGVAVAAPIFVILPGRLLGLITLSVLLLILVCLSARHKVNTRPMFLRD